ncbi:8c9d0a79-79e0-4098-a448-f28c3988b28c-CDS [Sclerotinia trifoliorum]|uniref:8c9d0a79-79e0-4098-a448-f28c3988b28c-CDS n=1 Tax=Sclerotinia trifoliorum TaxID=28548 RepID=A0A8H2VZH7_9HELO|nr:8c9d0a79-79e0-4098-a448-f28c3988b28c-CDS [Sclerotinia trifoliorum]
MAALTTTMISSTPNSLISFPLSLPQSSLSRGHTTFHNFRDLPPNIRSTIWRLAFLETQPPRLIEVRAHTEKNLFWDMDCENILFPQPTGSTVVRWMEINPRGRSVIENVSCESRKAVEGMWDFCFNDTHKEDLGMIELFNGDNGLEDARYLERKVIEETLGSSFRRGIKFLKDRDTIYLKTKDYETMRALLDSRGSMVNLSSLRKVAIDMSWNGNYLLEKQFFEGWNREETKAASKGEHDISEMRYIGEKPMLKELEELTMVMEDNPQRRECEIQNLSCQLEGKVTFRKQMITRDSLSDEALMKRMYLAVERLEEYEITSNGNVKIELVMEGHLAAC